MSSIDLARFPLNISSWATYSLLGATWLVCRRLVRALGTVDAAT